MYEQFIMSDFKQNLITFDLALWFCIWKYVFNFLFYIKTSNRLGKRLKL